MGKRAELRQKRPDHYRRDHQDWSWNFKNTTRVEGIEGNLTEKKRMRESTARGDRIMGETEQRVQGKGKGGGQHCASQWALCAV